MSLRVLGIDPGRRVGVALLEMTKAGHASGVRLATWTDESDSRLSDELLREVMRADIDVVGVERVERVHGSARMGSSYAEGLARGNWIGGLLAGLARAQQVRVVTVEAREWRQALVGSRTASDAQVASMVRLRVANWPRRSNEHERDAAGVAIWASTQ